jgi:hypothetical protein
VPYSAGSYFQADIPDLSAKMGHILHPLALFWSNVLVAGIARHDARYGGLNSGRRTCGYDELLNPGRLSASTLATRLKLTSALLRHRLQDNIVEPERGGTRVAGGAAVPAMGHHRLNGAGAREGTGNGGHLVKNSCQRVDVDEGIDALASDLLWCEIVRSADRGCAGRRLRLSPLRGHEGLGDAQSR